jgi:hypothetical protein
MAALSFFLLVALSLLPVSLLSSLNPVNAPFLRNRRVYGHQILTTTSFAPETITTIFFIDVPQTSPSSSSVDKTVMAVMMFVFPPIFRSPFF